MKHFSLEYLQAFVAACECGSFSGAARKLGKAQSAVSTAISNLEIDLGIELFDRSNRYPRLTEQGSAMLAEAKTILERCEVMYMRARAAHEQQELELVIAIDENLVIADWSYLLDEFVEQFPYVKLILLHPVAKGAIESVQQKEADLALVMFAETFPDDILSHSQPNELLRLVAAPSHPLAKAKIKDSSVFSTYRQIVITNLEYTMRAPWQYSNNVWLTESVFTAMQLVKAGQGWAVLPDELIKGSLAAQELVEVDIVDIESNWSIASHLIWHQSNTLGPAGRWMRQRFIERQKHSI
ncbi:LysR family transcriptional regulator [Paraferrimonas haliotis]|uniref:LysR family transcriptional regulator n=1 Tax=Paraferrimonas haliotis TaxID=2013866 RepID=A0AA37TSH6_9GAMM|nr:LysR family transcriptional regulator [Paraferrimonas haliotis]GLS82045.1 LysR family transcriptional regulator [Paraferrimonas haliotis]